MNTDEYKKLCRQPNAFSRGELEITRRTLQEKNLHIALRLSDILLNFSITKPKKHIGDKFTDYFLIDLPEPEVEIIIDVFTDLEVQSVGDDGTTTPLANFYTEMVDKWTRYLSFVEIQE
ncbi:MAG TPA: hypothetical protein VNI84_05950 [Pyrinomonadaceae bacterium]|nr:hypothetical protein [Pyrinomonadaceae bacterium]